MTRHGLMIFKEIGWTFRPGQPQLLILLFYYAVLLISLLIKKKKRIKWIPIVFGFVLLVLRPAPELSITMIDVGQGDSILIRAGKKLAFLSDCGSSSVGKVGEYRILPYLKQQGIHRLDGIFLSHPDADHINGTAALLNKDSGISIHAIYVPSWMKTNPGGAMEIFALCRKRKIPIIFLNRGDRIITGELRFDILHPQSGDMLEGNEGSLVFSLNYRDFSALFTGDLEGEGEEKLLKSMRQTHYQFLKVAHHGAKGATSMRFLERIDPEEALISAPIKSRYGHPHKELLSRLKKKKIRVWETRYCGEISIKIRKDKIYIRTFLK